MGLSPNIGIRKWIILKSQVRPYRIHDILWIITLFTPLFLDHSNWKSSREVALSVEIEIAESGHLRPLAATRWEQPLAATCGHSLGAATCGHLRPLAGSGHLRPLAATCRHLQPLEWLQVKWLQVAASGCKWCKWRCFAATCGDLRPLEWLQVAASGCQWLRVAASGCEGLRVVASGCSQRVAASGCKVPERYEILKSWKIGLEEKLFSFKFGSWIGKIYGVFSSTRKG